MAESPFQRREEGPRVEARATPPVRSPVRISTAPWASEWHRQNQDLET